MNGFNDMLLRNLIELPDGIEFYEVDDQISFPIYSGFRMIYLVKRPEGPNGTYYSYGIKIPNIFNIESIKKELKKGVKDFQLHLKGVKDKKVLIYNPDGGSLGKPRNE